MSLNREHHYELTVKWTGNTGAGTINYRGYERNYIISAEGKPVIEGSSDPAFRGDKTKYNPEELLVAALSTCHMLSYLYVCAVGGVVVVDYTDNAKGAMAEEDNGSGRFKEVTLYPIVMVKDASMVDKANELHKKANELCFISNSINFPVHHKPTCLVADN